MAERDVLDSSRWRPRRIARFAFHFTIVELQSLVFAMAIFAALALSAVVPLPIPRYDALLIFGVTLTLALWAIGWETGREVLVICTFHLIGLALELFKVHEGSWSYPEEALTKVAGVPLYAGFMYAAVGSYIVQAWRRMDLRVTNFRLVTMSILAVLAYANFFTHHWIPDLRWAIAIAFVIALWRTLGALHCWRAPLPDAPCAVVCGDWRGAVARGERRDVSWRLEVPRSARGVALGARGQGGIVVAARQSQLCPWWRFSSTSRARSLGIPATCARWSHIDTASRRRRNDSGQENAWLPPGRDARGGESHHRRETPQPWLERRRGFLRGLCALKVRHDRDEHRHCCPSRFPFTVSRSVTPLTGGSKPNLERSFTRSLPNIPVQQVLERVPADVHRGLAVAHRHHRGPQHRVVVARHDATIGAGRGHRQKVAAGDIPW